MRNSWNRIVSLLLVMGMLMLAPGALADTANELAPAFDADNIVLTFGAMADAHIMSKDSQASSEDLMNSMGQGDIEVKGYMACTSIGKTIYVYHFCASYEDFEVMEQMMIRMRDSVTVLD